MDAPRHAYTRTLLSAIPTLDPTPEGGVSLRWRFDEPARQQLAELHADGGILLEELARVFDSV